MKRSSPRRRTTDLTREYLVCIDVDNLRTDGLGPGHEVFGSPDIVAGFTVPERQQHRSISSNRKCVVQNPQVVSLPDRVVISTDPLRNLAVVGQHERGDPITDRVETINPARPGIGDRLADVVRSGIAR